MNTSLLTLPVRRLRDLVLARQRARQIARLVGFDLRGQLVFACGVFETACAAVQQLGRITLEFRLEGDFLKALCHKPTAAPVGPGDDDIPLTRPLPCVLKRLPQPLAAAPEDLAWVVRKVTRRTRADLCDELRHQNSETLRVLADLQRAEEKLAQAASQPAAAA